MSLPTSSNNDQLQPRHEFITISFSQIFSLLGAFLTLKFLRAVSSMASHRKPTRESIKRTEERIVTLFEDIIPESLYRPHSRCTFLCDTPLEPRDFNRRNAVADLRTASTEASNHYSSVPPDILSPARKPQCLSRSSGERVRERVREFPRSTASENQNNYQPVDHSVNTTSRQEQPGSGSVPRPVSPSSSRLNSLASSSFLACPPPQNTPVSAVQYLSIVVDQEQEQEQERPPRDIYTSQQRMSVDESDPDDLDIVNAYTVPDRELRRAYSAESYPGKFPVSDGLELCALASAPFYMRGKGNTSVRPFSDV